MKFFEKEEKISLRKYEPTLLLIWLLLFIKDRAITVFLKKVFSCMHL